MQNTVVLESEDSTTEDSTTEDSTTEDSTTEDSTTEDSIRSLQTGAPSLDQALRNYGIGKGAVVHLDCAPGQSSLGFLLSLCRAALDQGKRAVLLFVPPQVNQKSGDLTSPRVRAGDQLDPLLDKELAHFGLTLDEGNLGDTQAAFGYLVANTPDEFERHLDGLLPANAQSPDAPAPAVIAVYGLERLFSYLPLDRDSSDGWEEEVELLLEGTARLRSWVKDYSARTQALETTLYLSRSALSYTRPDDTIFARGLRPLLDSNCPVTLYVEGTLSHCRCGKCPWAVRGRFGIPVSLYEGGVLLTRVLVYVEESEKKVSGPFLDAAGIEASDHNPRRIDYRRSFL